MRLIAALLFLLLPACATPKVQGAMDMQTAPDPRFDVPNDRFISFDGAELGLTVWPSETDDVDYVVVGLHGMNDYANAFHMIAPWMAERGVTTYAYDQRGFGRSVNRGIWPARELLQQDFRTAIELAKDRHPGKPIVVIGISMGAAVAITVFGSDNPPEGVDRLILSGPGLRGWGSLNWLYSSSLWVSSHVRPGWVVRPPKGVKIEPTDNVEVMRQMWLDPLSLKDNRIDQVYGLVSLMEAAHKASPELPYGVPTMLTYGARDIVIPPAAVKRTVKVLPQHVRTAFYPNGYHMLLRDLQAETVFADMFAFMENPSAEWPSGVGPVPIR